jgi:hypothetical protein
VEDKMIRNIFYLSATLALLIMLTERSYAIDFSNWADQPSLRCGGGIVAIGDSERSVQDKCGDPLEIAERQDFGPVWIYHFYQSKWIYYLEVLNGKLQRIVSAPCNPNRYDCFDSR